MVAAMGIRSRWEQWMREARRREFTDHPWGYPSQQELENGPKYAPGGVDLSQYYPDPGDREKRRPAE